MGSMTSEAAGYSRSVTSADAARLRESGRQLSPDHEAPNRLRIPPELGYKNLIEVHVSLGRRHWNARFNACRNTPSSTPVESSDSMTLIVR